MSGKLYNVGKLVNTHGVRGDVKIISQTDFPDVRFAKGSRLVLVDPSLTRQVEVTVETAREHKDMFFVHFAGIDDINLVEPYKGWLLKVKEEDLLELEEDEYYYHEIVGCDVVTEDGEKLGTITEILSPGANDVWVVERPKGKPVLLPVIDDVLISVDIAAKTVTVRLMEGLIDG
ncbi:ribosome maturation factor RimM [Paenibacillus cymbidii]|uniref:ribosome maturation factor RimM n=1 Tax=Paenibacillus cymbidii TaxID=1639034 RepID=UPI0010810CBB|nr:ribosome maturation factor RimM [Paenibacillus cymbidii]